MENTIENAVDCITKALIATKSADDALKLSQTLLNLITVETQRMYLQNEWK